MSSIVNWLPGVLPKIFDDRDVQRELSRHLEEIDPRIKWEAGPYGDEETYLAFSPNFHNDLLSITEELAMAMPAISGWRFLGSKPRKLWSVRKILYKGVEYFFNDWRYRLVMFKGGDFFDVELFTFDEKIDESARAGLGVFLVSSELGEKLFMRAIDRVNVSIWPQPGESSIHIESLCDQITELFLGDLQNE